ncbi:hypothetical protein [Caulifigura coniformis]|nr:hypothetical protein [Caulifigura coniformis]
MLFDGFLAEATIDGEGRKAEAIRNCLLCGLTSKNGRTIPAPAFGGAGRAKSLYEGVHVYLNHDIEAGISRRVQELAGIVENVRLDSLGRPRGDIRLNENKAGDELRQLAAFAAKAEKAGSPLKHVGMSHVARYTFSALDRTVVQSVDEVFSVDVVIRPATTKSFSESNHSVSEKPFSPSDFLDTLNIDLQAFSKAPVEYAFGEADLFDAPLTDERSKSSVGERAVEAIELGSLAGDTRSAVLFAAGLAHDPNASGRRRTAEKIDTSKLLEDLTFEE